MNSVIISVEVNPYWIRQCEGRGQAPFSELKDVLVQQYPEVVFSVNGNTLEITNVEPSENSGVRQCIREYFTDRYQMTIAGGDYNMTARIYAGATPPRRNSARAQAKVEADRGAAEEATAVREGGTASGQENPDEPDTEKTPGHPTEEEADHNAAKERLKAYAAAHARSGAESEAREAETELPTARPDQEAERFEIPCPQLESFLREMEEVMQNARHFRLGQVPWFANVLLSIDEGYGVSTVGEKIVDVMTRGGVNFRSKTQKSIEEHRIPQKPDEAEEYWGKLLEHIEKYYREEQESGKRSSNMPLAFCIDITECLGQLNKQEFHETMYKLAKIKGSFLYIFRIPYLETVALNKVREFLEDMFLIRQVAVAPFSNEEMVGYLKSRLREFDIEVAPDIDDMLERLILREKRDGHFRGLKTIDRLVSDVVYQKLLHGERSERLSLTREDLNVAYDEVELRHTDPATELSDLTGMGKVKQTIDEIIAQILLYQEMKAAGKKLNAPTMHMRFVGAPGTGKTTVARIVARLFREKGILNKGYFYEIKARDLCGRYVGETAPKTSAYCRDALGSVLFIDEAYSLYRAESGKDYGMEAIETLITEMENNRDNLVVIMAGYKQEMDAMMGSNPGLRSRMPYEIVFENYNRQELVEIFYSMLGDNFSYTDGFDQAIREFVDSIPDSSLESENFSNGRLMRNLYERIWSKAAYRRSRDPEGEFLLSEDDVRSAVSDEEFQKTLKGDRKVIGF